MRSIYRWQPILALLAGYLLLVGSSWEPGAQKGPSSLSPKVSKHVSLDEPVLALTRVRVFDGTGRPARENQTIVVEGSTIVATGPAETTTIPAGAKVLDLSGRTVVPGLVGMHNHTHMPGAPELFYTSATQPCRWRHHNPDRG